MALPAVQALRVHLPETHLIGMVRSQHVELAERIQALDEVVPAPPQTDFGFNTNWWSSIAKLRSANLDGAILLASSFEAALTVWLAGIPVRIGWDSDYRSILLTKSVAVNRVHDADVFLSVVESIGAKPVSGPATLMIRPAEHEYVDRLFDDAGWSAKTQLVFINPASVKIPRAWSSDRFRKLAELIVERHPGMSVIVHHYPPFDMPKGWPRSRTIRAVSEASLVELAALIQRCVLYVGNDSGPKHLAAALGVPTVGIYGPSMPVETFPRGMPEATHLSVSAGFSCSPCKQQFFKECPSPPTEDGRPPCLDQVTVQMVAAQVDRVLKGACT